MNDGYRFGFNGMEREREVFGSGESYDFGARMYNPRLGRWFSIDPLQRNYANHSPYTFTADNPVLYVDVDGQDYEVYIDHSTKTVMIKATFYTVHGDATAKASAEQAAAFWESQNGNFTYRVKNPKGEKERYKVQFVLDIKEARNGVTPDGEVIRDQNNYTSLSPQTPGDGSNTYYVVPEADWDDDDNNGYTTLGNGIYVRDGRKYEMTGAHEIGHALGLFHPRSKGTIMYKRAGHEKRANKVTAKQVQRIIRRSKIRRFFQRKPKARYHDNRRKRR